MTEHFYMFDSVDGDREYTAQDFADYFNEILTTGVFYRNQQPSLRVRQGTGLHTNLDIGGAYVEGYIYRNTAPIEFLHAAGNPSYPRIDRIVIRLDKSISNRYVRTFIKEGTPATNPQPPELQRDDMVYEISLAQVRVNPGASSVASVTDERLNQDVCGVVSSLIEVPTSVFLQEWNEFYDAIVDNVEQIKQGYEQTIANNTSQANQSLTDYVNQLQANKQGYEQVIADNTDQADQSLTDYISQLQANLDGYGDEFNVWLADQQTEGFVLGGFRFYTGSTQPTNPNLNDRWLDTSDE